MNTYVEKQCFFIDVEHPNNAFATEGREHTFDFNNWLKRALEISKEYPHCTVKCSTLARIRYIIKNGVIIKEWKEYPYLGRTTEQW